VTVTERQIRVLLWIALALVGLGVWAFLLRGADQPADPRLAPAVAVLPDGVAPPGDPSRVPLDDFDEIAVTVAPEGGGSLLSWCLLAALQASQREQGLMGVTDLQGYSGMAFVYDTDVQSPFWMRNTPTPLSIAWIARDGSVVSISDMAPCGDRSDCPIYGSTGRYRTAIEVFQGQLATLGITPGAKVTVGGECAARV
jgi:uncharacterized membrane protein (UPF0127 family)